MIVGSCRPGNGGIVPPWLREPVRIVLPVEPDDDVRLPVEPPVAPTPEPGPCDPTIGSR